MKVNNLTTTFINFEWFDSLLFKLIVFSLIVGCSLTFHPMTIGRSAIHGSFIYFDTFVLFFTVLLTLFVRIFIKYPTPDGIKKIFIPVILLGIWWLFSGIMNAKKLDFFIVSIIQFFNGILVILIFPWILNRYKLIDFAMNSIMGVGICVSIFAFIEGFFEPEKFFEDITSTLTSNHAHIALYMLVVLAISLNRLVRIGGKFSTIAAFLSFLTLLISGSRAGQIGSVILLFSFFIQRLSFLNFVKITLALLFIGTVLVYIGKSRQDVVKYGGDFQISENVKVDKSAGRRLLMWVATWKCITSSPNNFIYGFGFSNFRWEFGRQIKLPFFTNAAHNAFLHIWAETGLVGLLFYLFSYFSLLRFSFLNARRNGSVLFLGGLVVAVLLTAFTQETLYPNEAFANFNVFYYFSCLLLVMDARAFQLTNKK